ncbi:MAG: DNA-deoxyinosine glycosylase [Sphingomicrobium sp.]
MDAIKAGLAPIARSDARLFILGSLPGDVSLAQARYYAHPTNQFWRLVGTAIGEELHALDYAARLERLAERRIGLWDVLASARRAGSLDQGIRDPRHNPVAELPERFPELRAIAFNGAKAASGGRRLIGPSVGVIALIDLPSSSAAFTLRFADKARAWSVLADYCGSPSAAPR